jgi:hypothetical protein
LNWGHRSDRIELILRQTSVIGVLITPRMDLFDAMLLEQRNGHGLETRQHGMK